MDNRHGGQRAGNDDRWSQNAHWSHDPNDSLPPARLVSPPFMPPPSRKVLLLVGLATALVVVLIGTAFLLRAPASPRVAQAQPTPDVSSLLSGTPISQGATVTPAGAVATQLPAPGWVNAGPAFAQNIGFAPSDPNTVYVCGNRRNSGGGAASMLSAVQGMRPLSSLNALQFTVGVSHDGGVTWQLSQPPGQGNSCAMLISPVNPQSAVLVVSVCNGCQRSTLNRTDDGGQTWVTVTLPPNGGFATTEFGNVVWAGGTLFVTPYIDQFSGTPAHFLAASVNGGLFSWVDTNGFFTSATQKQAPQLIGEGSTVYAILADNSCPACTLLAVSTTNGLAWSHVTPRDHGIAVQVQGGSSGKSTLYGFASITTPLTPFERSTDGGQTWNPLPMPTGMTSEYSSIDAPDGTIYASFARGGAVVGTYRFDPQSANWQPMTSIANGMNIIAVQMDAQGHPVALWSQSGFDPTTELQYPGLQRHAP